MSKFVTADPHGRFDALQDVLKQVKFNAKKDTLIVLGDTADGGPQVKECFDLFVSIAKECPDHLKYVRGNHDDWFLRYCLGHHPGKFWLEQGGKATLRSYGYQYFFDPDTSKIPKEHIDLLINSYHWYEDEDAIYVHGGIDLNNPRATSCEKCMWDREFIRREYTNSKFFKPVWTEKLIVVGHTCTQWFTGSNKPFISEFAIDLDTGAGHGSKLTIMELPSRQYWQSTLPEFDLIRDI